MDKRGQVSVFVIIAIVVLAAIALIFVFRDSILSGLTKAPDVQKQLEIKMSSISQKIDKCIVGETGKAVDVLANQGGYFELLKFKSYYGKNIGILCQKIVAGEHCYNVMSSKKDIESRMNNFLNEKVKYCININSFDSESIKVAAGDMDINVTTEKENIMVKLGYPIIVSKGDSELKRDEFVKVISNPFGSFIDIASDIVGEESTKGDFDVGEYSKMHPGFIIDPRDTSDVRVYRIADADQKNEFWFGVER